MKTYEDAVKSFSATHNKSAEVQINKYDDLRTEIASSEWTEALAANLLPYIFSAGPHHALMMAIAMGVEIGVEMEKAELPEVIS